MLKLQKLTFQNIGRFVEEQTIDFTNLSGLIQVDAQNLNSNGSSGAGKSTIFLAIEYLFGVNSTPTTILQSRLTKNGICVSGQFDYDGRPLTITRSKKGLLVDLNGHVTEGSSKLSEEVLDKIIGMPRELFRLIIIKRQREGGFFLSMTSKQTYSLLADAKGLKGHFEKLKEIEEDLKSLEEHSLTSETNVKIAESKLSSVTEMLNAIGAPPPESNITEEYLNELSYKHEELVSHQNYIQQKHQREKVELSALKPVSNITSFDRTRIVKLEKEISEIDKLTNSIKDAERNRQAQVKSSINSLNIKQITLKNEIASGDKAKTQIAKIAQELKKIKENTCPTCEQPWLHESIQKKEVELTAQFEEQKAIVVRSLSASAELAAVSNSLTELSAQANPIVDPELKTLEDRKVEIKVELEAERRVERDHNEKQNEAFRSENNAYIQQLNELSTKHANELSVIKDEIFKSNSKWLEARQKHQADNNAVRKYKETQDNLLAEREKKSEEFLTSKRIAIKAKEDLEITTEAKALVKSFISCSFDEALESISDKATSILRGIPNMATATIQLEGTKESAKGVVKEEVTAVLSVDGEQNVPIKSLSGGERSSVDLAIDLAVIDFLEAESGIGANFYVADEPFTGLDAISIEQVLEILQNSNLNKKLIIVDHNDVVKEFVQNRILVTRTLDTSTVEVL